MNENERIARLLCEAQIRKAFRQSGCPVDEEWLAGAVDIGWDSSQYTGTAESLVAGGLTILPLEPDEETVDKMATIIDPEGFRPKISRERARSAYRAAVEGRG